MNSVAVIVLALTAVCSAGIVGPALVQAPLGYVHGPVYPGYGYQVAPAPLIKAVHPAVYAAPIAPVLKHHVAYSAPLVLHQKAVVHPAPIAYAQPLLAKAPVVAPFAYGAYGHPLAGAYAAGPLHYF